jgi:anthranilate/para-aminobenzoate synthase component II
MKTLVIDNYDSFVYNLVQYVGELGTDVVVYRNDQVTLQQVQKLKPDRIVISPGPGNRSAPLYPHWASASVIKVSSAALAET